MSKFEVNEIVVVMDRSQYYEAKILIVECFSKVWKYFVHYQGWNRKWDCWVDDSLVFKYDDEGTAKLKESKLNQKRKKTNSTNEALVSSSASVSDGSRATRCKKRVQEETLESKRRKKQLLQSDMYDAADEGASVLKLLMPLTLKKHMVDEWKTVTSKPGRLLSLPRVFTVSKVIEEFLTLKRSKIDEKAYKKYHDLFHGLKQYFDKALPLVLLYRQERSQYESLALSNSSNGKIVPSDVYGVEHLLRLFVRIPHLSSEATIAPTDATFVQQKLLELLKYIQKSSTTYFNIMDYIDPEKSTHQHVVKSGPP